MLSWLVRVVGENLPFIGLAVIVATIGVWAARDTREADSYQEAAKQTGDRARRYTGGVLGFLGVLAYGLLGTMYQTGLSLAEFGDMAVDVVLMAPAVFVGFGTIVVAGLGLEGVLEVPTMLFVGLAVTALGLAVLARRRSDGGGDWL